MRWFDPAYQNLVVGNANTTLDGSETTLISQDGSLREANVLDLGTFLNVKSPTFGAKGDGVTNDASAIQAAINTAALVGGILYFPPGIYLIGTTTLVFKNKVTYIGSGKDSATTLGTVIKYTGTSDAIQINNPINSSTAANITIQDLWVLCTTRTAGKAAIADVGSTFLSFKRVAVSGNDYGIILDQSEVALLDECDFELSSGSSTAGLWLVSGAEHTGGASPFFTNRITVKNCQFNSGVGIGVGIADDGGVQHTFIDNNMNNLTTQFRICGTTDCIIARNECEGYSVTCVSFPTTKIGGGAATQGSNARVDDNVISSTLALPAFTFGSAMLTTLTMNNNSITQSNAGGTYASGLSAGVTTSYTGQNNTQGSIGADPDATFVNTYNVQKTFTPTWKGDSADPVIGNGTINGSYERNGNMLSMHITITMGSTTTFGTGQWYFLLPFNAVTTTEAHGSAVLLDSSASTFFNGVPRIHTSAPTKCYVSTNNSTSDIASNSPFVWATSDQLRLSITFPITKGSS